MNSRRHIEENDCLKGLVGMSDINYSPRSTRVNEIFYSAGIEVNEILHNVGYKVEDYYTSFIHSKNHCFQIGNNEILGFKTNSFVNASPPVKYFTESTVLSSSSLLYGKAVEYYKNDLLHIPNKVNELTADVSNLEGIISSELKSLYQKEVKCTSLVDFAEEYKREFEITDEELWLEFGPELSAIIREIEAINKSKRDIYASKGFIEKAKRLIYRSSWKIKSLHRCEIRHHIAFSTKNLDDEHISGVKLLNSANFTHSDFVLYEKANYNKTFTFSL